MSTLSIDRAIMAIKSHGLSIRKFLRDMGNLREYSTAEVTKWMRNSNE